MPNQQSPRHKNSANYSNLHDFRCNESIRLSRIDTGQKMQQEVMSSRETSIVGVQLLIS